MFDRTIRHYQAIFMLKILSSCDARSMVSSPRPRRPDEPLEDKFGRRHRRSSYWKIRKVSSDQMISPLETLSRSSRYGLIFVLQPNMPAAPQLSLTAVSLLVRSATRRSSTSATRFWSPERRASAIQLRPVGCDTQEETFKCRREISSPRASHQHANFVVKAQGERRDRDLTLSGRIWNHETRNSFVTAQPAAGARPTSAAERGMLTVGPTGPPRLANRHRVVQTGARESRRRMARRESSTCRAFGMTRCHSK